MLLVVISITSFKFLLQIINRIVIFAKVTIKPFMRRTLLRLIIVGFLIWGIVPMVCAKVTCDDVGIEISDIYITQESQSVVRVVGAQGRVLEVYKVTGVGVDKIKIDSNDKRIELDLPKGCYILKVGKVVRKISIK